MGSNTVLPAATDRKDFSGAEGMRAASLSAGLRLGCAVPAHFRMTVHSLRADGAGLRAVQTGPVVATRGPAEIAARPSCDVRVVYLVEGRLRARYGERDTTIDPGDVLLTRGRSAVSYELDAPTRTLSVNLPETFLSVGAIDPDRLPDGPLPSTRLVDALRAVLGCLSTGPDTTDAGEARLIVHAATELAASALAGAAGSDEPQSAAVQLRRRILGHIERHLDDPELGPASIAREFSISLRYLHLLFAQEEETVARTIRSRRLAEAERLVVARPGGMTTEQLRRRLGFTSAEQLSRGFRQRYGSSIRDYRRC